MRLLAVAAALSISAMATPLQAEESCKIDTENGMNVCSMPEPLTCEGIDAYQSPRHFAESMGGVVFVWEPTSATEWILGIRLYEGEQFVGNFIFRVDQTTREVCLMATGKPIKQGTAL